MLFTSASLPLHHDREHSGLSRRVGFEQEDPSIWTKIREYLRKVVYIAIHAPTGSPSDGMGGDGTESTTSTSAFIAAQKQITAEKDGEDWKVDEVVVTGEDVDRWKRLGSERDTTTGGTPGQSDTGSVRNNTTRDSPSSQGGNVYHPSLGTKAKHVWSFVENFFSPTFEDEHAEADFKKQNWYSTKAIAFYASLYLILNWALYLALNKESTEKTSYAQGVYYGGLTLLTVPLPFLIAADVPLRYPVPFQVWFTVALWWCGVTEIIQMKLCHFFGDNNCNRKDFLAMMYYITAVPAMMMFVVPHRLPSFMMMVVVLVLISTFIMTEEGLFARNLISYILFSTFLQVLHYNKEITERRLYLLNNQLKVAYKAQQKAQMAQSRASQAKRRFASYIFHEVRVPLNNAAIAFHNLTTSNAFSDRVFKPHAEDVIALEVSLATVQQVLNDSLDLEKMDAGHFDINPHPFPLHSVIRSTLAPLIVSAAAKKLDLRINLDERIDKLAYRMNVEENGHKDWHGEKESNRQSRSLDNPLPNYSTPPSPDLSRPRPFEATDHAGMPPKMERKRSSSSMHSPKARHTNFKHPRPEPYISSLPNVSAGSADSRGAGELWVVGDEVRLRQVLTNLMSNAVKFTPEGAEGGITFNTSLVTSVPRSMTIDANDENLAVPDEKKRSGSREGRASREGREKDGKSGVSQDMLVLRMEVVDNGPGIRPSDLVDNQLFQPFAQTRVGRLSKNSTGLGLAIVRQIVSLSGGKLGVQSQKGRGATFWVELSYPIARMRDVEEGMKSCPSSSYFPRTMTADSEHHWGAFSEDLKNPLPPSTGLPTPPIPPALTPLTEISEMTVVNAFGTDPFPPEQLTGSAAISLQNGISVDVIDTPLGTESNETLLVLVVDDDAITRKMMSRWLSLRGCVVHTAKDGKECLDILLSPEAPKYDFVSLDNYMPSMTGEEAVKEIRSSGRDDIFVVGCTGNALTDDQKSFLVAGANRVLTKPINFKAMEQILQTARKRRAELNDNS